MLPVLFFTVHLDQSQCHNRLELAVLIISETLRFQRIKEENIENAFIRRTGHTLGFYPQTKTLKPLFTT